MSSTAITAPFSPAPTSNGSASTPTSASSHSLPGVSQGRGKIERV